MNIETELHRAIQLCQTEQFQQVQAIYDRVMSRGPTHPDSLHVLGLIAYQIGYGQESESLVSRAIQGNPDNPIFYNSLGNIFRLHNEPQKAMRCFRQALKLKPEYGEAHFNLGRIYHDREALDMAVSCYMQAAETQPDLVEAHYNAGLIYQGQSHFAKATVCYENALQLNPDFAEAHNNLGKIYHLTGAPQKAETCFQKAIRLRPDFAEPYFNLAEVFAGRKDNQMAIPYYRKALQLKPDMSEAYNNLGNVLKNQGDFDGAIENYRHIIRLNPELAEGHYNLGSTYRLAQNTESAIRHLKAALQLKPDYAEAFNNLGLAYKNQGDLERAIINFTQAVKFSPRLAEAYWNRSFCHLLAGNFAEGWQDFEWRFALSARKTIYPHRLKKARWNGSSALNKRIFVHDEQGLGDTIQFIRYLPMVKSLCGSVTLETRAALMPLFDGFPGIEALVARSTDAPVMADCDCYVPLLSLPHMFNTIADTIPAQIPYLYANSTKADDWHQRLGGHDFKIGLVWAGRPQHANDRNRSIALKQLAPLGQIPGVRLIGLQKGEASIQVKDLPGGMQVSNYGEEFKDFADTAALIENLDLVISVDTAVAHLAGAMGKPVWVLLPFIPDWRWMIGREDSPWYPTMRLFRQQHPGDWNPVIECLVKALENRGFGDNCRPV